MKKIIATLAFAAAVLGAGAQNAAETFRTVDLDSPDNHGYFGVRVALDVTVPTKLGVKTTNGTLKTDAFNTGAGFSIGGVYNLPVWRNLYFEPGLNLYYHHNAVNKNFIDYFGDDFTKASFSEFGFTIPLMFGYHFDFQDFKLYAFTGPELALGLSGKMHYTGYVNGLKMSGSESAYSDDGFNRGNVFWRFGAGASFCGHYYVAISGGPGLCNWQKVDGLSERYNVVSLTLGYNF